MMAEMAAAPALQVGDLVELTEPLRGRPLKVGQVGEVEVVGLPFRAVSVRFGTGALMRLYQVRAQHLRRVGHQVLEKED